MGEEGEAGEEEADNVEEEDEGDHEVEIQKLGAVLEWRVLSVIRTGSQPAGELADLRHDVCFWIKILVVHDQCHHRDEKRKALGVDDVDKQQPGGAVGLVLLEGVEHGAGDVDAHGGHPEEEGDHGVLDQIAQADAAAELEIVVLVMLKEDTSTIFICTTYICTSISKL